MSYQQKIRELPTKHTLEIRSGVRGGTTIHANLPDGFGFTVGNVFSSPFDTGALNGMIAKGAAVGAIGLNQMVSMQKVFMNPEPTEISFEMKFDAYYDPVGEVVAPVINLLRVSLSRQLNSATIDQKVKDIIQGAYEIAGGSGEIEYKGGYASVANDATGEKLDTALELIGFIASPDTVSIRFGDVYTIRDAFISSVGIAFSNKLDRNGMPMSCTCNVSAVLRRPPTVETVLDNWFGVE